MTIGGKATDIFNLGDDKHGCDRAYARDSHEQLGQGMLLNYLADGFGERFNLLLEVLIEVQLGINLRPVIMGQGHLLKVFQPPKPKKIAAGNLAVVLHQQHVNSILHAGTIVDQSVPMP